MKRASLFASAAVATLLAGAAAMPVFAQGTGGPFADVPVDHWAYKAVDTLQKDGIVIGYPDGTYGGKRAMTRYEFAVAIARLLDKIPAAPDLTKYVTQDQLNTALTPYALKTDLAGFAKQSDLDALKKLVDEFQTELTTLGVDLDATKRRLAALEGRVAAIEQELKRVKVGGDVNVMARAQNRFGSGGQQVTDYDGLKVTGVGSGSLLHDSQVMHDVDISIKARLSDTATAETIIDYGNYLPTIGSIASYNQNPTLGGLSSGRSPLTGANQSEDFTVYKAVIETPVKLPALGGSNVTVGRLPIQFTPYTLKLIDTDSYFYNSKTDLGDIPVDGGKITLNLGPVGVTAFGAKVDPIEFVSNSAGTVFGANAYGLYAGAAYGGYTGENGKGGFAGVGVRQVYSYDTGITASSTRPVGSGVNPYVNGAMSIDQMAGVRANIGTGKVGTIGATYLYAAGGHYAPDATVDTLGLATGIPGPSNHDGFGEIENFNRVAVYGADINTNVIGLGIVGSYTKSDTQGPQVNGDGSINTGSHSDITNNNYAWDAGATYAKGSYSLTGGYKVVEPYFAAPGYWDKIGAYTNPTDIKGPYVKGKLNFSNSIGLEVAAKFYQGTGDASDNGGLLTSDKIQNLKAGLKFGLTSASSVDAGIERTQYTIGGVGADGNTGDKPIEYFYNIGYGYSFTPAASFKLLYQIVDYRDVNSGFDPLSGKGGIAATQFSVKF